MISKIIITKILTVYISFLSMVSHTDPASWPLFTGCWLMQTSCSCKRLQLELKRHLLHPSPPLRSMNNKEISSKRWAVSFLTIPQTPAFTEAVVKGSEIENVIQSCEHQHKCNGKCVIIQCTILTYLTVACLTKAQTLSEVLTMSKLAAQCCEEKCFGASAVTSVCVLP